MNYVVHDLFLTLQGEGGRAGARSVFVRFAGCNLWSGRPEDRGRGAGACARWCDTSFVGGDRLSARVLVERMRALWGDAPEPWCVLTGGEPLLQLDDELLEALVGDGWYIAIETNGTIASPLLWRLDWVTVSPKKRTKLEVVHGHEVKVVLPGDDVVGWTDDELIAFEAMSFDHYFVQPQDPIDPERVEVSLLRAGHERVALSTRVHREHQFAARVERCIDFIHRRPRWRLSLQSHKFVALP